MWISGQIIRATLLTNEIRHLKLLHCILLADRDRLVIRLLRNRKMATSTYRVHPWLLLYTLSMICVVSMLILKDSSTNEDSSYTVIMLSLRKKMFFRSVSNLGYYRILRFARLMARSLSRRGYILNRFVSILYPVSFSYSSIHLVLSGDVELNPGPNYRFPCPKCDKPVKSNQKGLQCDKCDKWFHNICELVPARVYSTLANCDDKWFCSKCLMMELPFGDVSLCEDPVYDLESGSSLQDSKEGNNIGDYKQGLLVSHLNVRSLVPKLDELPELLANLSRTGLVVGLSETWLDGSVTDGQLEVAGLDFTGR